MLPKRVDRFEWNNPALSTTFATNIFVLMGLYGGLAVYTYVLV